MEITRRQVLSGAGAAAGAAALGALASPAWSAPAGATGLPTPDRSGIDHVVVVMMENRSFDHFLGWVPGARGQQSGLTYTDRYGIPHRTHHLTDFQGCGHPDPDHSYEGGRVQYNDGKCDGWLRSGENDEFAIGYYTDADQAFYGRAARDWTVCDSYFSAVLAETYPNRFYQHAAQTDRTHNSTSIATMPTIWDRLSDAGVPARYYFNDVPFLALWGTKYAGVSSPFTRFQADAAAGSLPAVSFVDPQFTDESTGTSADDHPHSDIRAGQHFLDTVYDTLVSSPNWARTVLVINYDEWGGFYDHVAPTTAPDARPDCTLRGFRVPCLVISPMARRGYVAHDTYDHTSVLKMIEWRWSLPPLTPRDAAARNLAEVLDFSVHDTTAPRYDVPPVVGRPCAAAGVDGSDFEDWKALKTQALSQGWTLP
jgi:phospholipase C